MKRIFTFALAAVAALTISAARNTVWTGNEPISWNTDVYAGTQFETPDGTFVDLIAGDTILVTFTKGLDDPQYVLTYKAGEGYNWTDLSTTIEDGVMSYIVESDQIGKEIAERSLIFRGQGYNITSIVVAGLEIDQELEETVVWSTETPVAISWDSESWPGEQLDTHGTNSDMFYGLKADNVIHIAISSKKNDAEFSMKYKPLEGWGWSDIAFSRGHDFIRIKITDQTMADFITERGLVISGKKYYVNKISVLKDNSSATAIDNVQGGKVQSTKVLRNGQLYILHKGTMYNVQGQTVE